MTAKTIQVTCVQLHWAAQLERNVELTLHYIDQAARAGSRVVLFPEANLTSYYFPYLINLPEHRVESALQAVRAAAGQHRVWVIAGTIRKSRDRFLNLAQPLLRPRGELAIGKLHQHLAALVLRPQGVHGVAVGFFHLLEVNVANLLLRLGGFFHGGIEEYEILVFRLGLSQAARSAL